MIKRTIISAMLLLAFQTGFSQAKLKINFPQKEENISPLVKEKVEKYSLEINEIVKEEKKEMEAELQEITAQQKAGNLSEEEANQQKKAIAQRYSEKIDRRIEKLGFDIDEIVRKQVKYSLFNEDISKKEDIVANEKNVLNITSYLSYSAMILTNNKEKNELDEHKDFANNLEFGLKFNYQFSTKSPWAFVSGLGFSWRTLRLDDNYYFSKNNIGNVEISQSEKILDKSKLRVGYLILPIGLQYNFSRPKEVEGKKYYNYYNGWKLGVNVYGGVRISTNNITKGEDFKTRDKQNYGLNPLVYGVQLSIGYNKYSLVARQDFNNYFKDDFKNTKMFSIGLRYDF